LLKKYKKNKKSTIKNLSKILKNKDLSDVDFASNIQNAMRNYLEARFDFPFTKTVSSEIKEKYLFAVESASEQKVCAIECIQKIFCQTDIIRYGQKSFGINKTSFLENEKETLVDQLIQSIETLEVVEVFEIENKEKNIKEGENNA
jgi:hypothetical protein